MKETLIERQVKHQKDVNKVRELAKDAPVGQLLHMMEPIIEEALYWSGHPDFSREYILGLMVTRIVDCQIEKDIDEKYEQDDNSEW